MTVYVLVLASYDNITGSLKLNVLCTSLWMYYNEMELFSAGTNSASLFSIPVSMAERTAVAHALFAWLKLLTILHFDEKLAVSSLVTF